MTKPIGTVYLIGAGPGAIGLLTLRGADLLSQAEVVIYDSLVNPDLIRLAPSTAEVIFGGKRPSEVARRQKELNRLLVTKARQGKRVVRLKGGDPYVFGRGAEEAEELAAAGVPFEVVPGVSSFAAVPSYAGIPLTHRAFSSSFTVFTGHEDPEQPDSDIDWAKVAHAPGTKVALMAVKKIKEIAATLIAEGMPKATPIAMIRWGTMGRQEVLEGTLANIAGRVAARGFQPPAVAVIGPVVKLRSKLNWFEKRPLHGQRVVVTRARTQAPALANPLREKGAEVLEVPTIRFAEPTERKPLTEAIGGLNAYDWLVFSSANGVTSFFDSFFKAFTDLRDLGGVRIAAVGPATAAKVQELHLQVDAVPTEYVGSQIASALAEHGSLENLRVLLLRAEIANEMLVKHLEDLGAIVDDVACYRTVGETKEGAEAAKRMLDEGFEWLTFTSGSTVEHFHRRFDLPALLERYPQARMASIGPETTRTLAALKLKPHVEADPHTMDGLIAAIEAAAGPAA